MNTHAHHFVIATPDGSHERPGRCKHCGEERMFNIAGPIDPWDSMQIESRKRGVGRARQARKEMMMA